MNIDAGRGAIDEGKRPRRTLDRLTPAGKPGQVEEPQAPSPSQKSVDRSKPTARNVSRGPKKKAKEAVRDMPPLSAWLRRLGHYGLALLFVAVAATVRWALAEELRPTPFLVFYLAWVGAAAFGGLGPGLLATVVSWLCVDFLFDSAPGHVGFADPASLARLVILLAGGLSVSLVAERMRRGLLLERRQGRELAELVQLTDLGPFLIRDEQDRIVRWSEGCARLYGFTAEQAIGRVSHELLRTQFPQPPEAIQATLHKTGRWEGELTHRRADGTIVHVASLWTLRDGTAASVVLQVDNDITERQRAEEALRRSDEFNRRLIEGSFDCIKTLDVEGNLLSMNSGGQLLLEIEDLRPLLNTCWIDFWEEQDRPRVAEAVAAARAGGVGRCQAYCPTAAGKPKWWDVVVTPICDANGQVERLLSISRDITDLRQAEETLRESEERYHRLFAGDLTGDFLCTPEGQILLCNPAFARMFGFSSVEEALGRSMLELYGDSRERQPLLETLRQQRKIEGFGAWRKRRDGRPIYIVENLVGHFNDRGELSEVQGYIVDDTGRKQAEEALRELNATLESRVAQRTKELEHRAWQLQKLTLELSEAEERERKRLAEILHDDLQQVLAAAKFQVSLLSSRVENDAESQELAGQARELLVDAIAKSRSLSHELSAPALSRTDLCEAFEWLAEQMQKKHGFTVHLDMGERIELASEPLRVLLYKAAQELLFNAIKHAGVHEATLRLRRQRGRLRLSVSDGGRGFDPTEPGGNLGFGLLSIRERVEYLGGRLKIRSAVGKGSTFLITVPDSDARDGE